MKVITKEEREAQELADAEVKATTDAKTAKELALNTITVTTSSGKVFDGHSEARLNMSNAIQASEILSQSTANWKLANNEIVNISVDELKEALALSIQRVGKIVTGA